MSIGDYDIHTCLGENYLQTVDFGSIGKFALVAEPNTILSACYDYTINFPELEDQTTTVPKDCNFSGIKGYRTWEDNLMVLMAMVAEKGRHLHHLLWLLPLRRTEVEPE